MNRKKADRTERQTETMALRLTRTEARALRWLVLWENRERKKRGIRAELSAPSIVRGLIMQRAADARAMDELTGEDLDALLEGKDVPTPRHL